METPIALNEVLELEAKVLEAKEKQRSIAIDYVKKIIKSFGLNAYELFVVKGLEDASKFRPVKKLHEIYASNPNISRKDFLAAGALLGINHNTSTTQYYILRKKHDSCGAKSA